MFQHFIVSHTPWLFVNLLQLAADWKGHVKPLPAALTGSVLVGFWTAPKVRRKKLNSRVTAANQTRWDRLYLTNTTHQAPTEFTFMCHGSEVSYTGCEQMVFRQRLGSSDLCTCFTRYHVIQLLSVVDRTIDLGKLVITPPGIWLSRLLSCPLMNRIFNNKSRAAALGGAQKGLGIDCSL